jgi:hypothetical protein
VATNVSKEHNTSIFRVFNHEQKAQNFIAMRNTKVDKLLFMCTSTCKLMRKRNKIRDLREKTRLWATGRCYIGIWAEKTSGNLGQDIRTRCRTLTQDFLEKTWVKTNGPRQVLIPKILKAFVNTIMKVRISKKASDYLLLKNIN